MKTITNELINELGNRIAMSTTRDHRGITIFASGPTSEVEHTWTPMEAAALRDMLNALNINVEIKNT